LDESGGTERHSHRFCHQPAGAHRLDRTSDGLDEKILEAVLADKFDLAKAAADYEQQQQENQKWMAVNKKLREAMKQNKWDDAATTLDEILKMAPN